MDRREFILNNEYNLSEIRKGILSTFPVSFPDHYKEAAINAMDVYMKECSLELLEYIAKNRIELDIVKGEMQCYWPNGEGITKEQLFESFL